MRKIEQSLNASDKIKGFLDMVDYCVRVYPLIQSQLENENKKQQDLLHEIEFTTKASERSKTATRLHENRLERRYWKDLEEETGVIVEYLSDPANKKAIDKLTQVLGKMRKVENYHENRSYKKRALPEIGE